MFSNDSRWDRHLPHQEYQEQSIKVGAIFSKEQILPRWFVWQGRRYQIKNITYNWQDKRGNGTLHFFSVSDGHNLFQIYLNSEHMHWRITKVGVLED